MACELLGRHLCHASQGLVLWLLWSSSDVCYATYSRGLCKLLLSYRLKGNPISANHGCDGFDTRHMLYAVSASMLSWIADVLEASHMVWNKWNGLALVC